MNLLIGYIVSLIVCILDVSLYLTGDIHFVLDWILSLL